MKITLAMERSGDGVALNGSRKGMQAMDRGRWATLGSTAVRATGDEARLLRGRTRENQSSDGMVKGVSVGNRTREDESTECRTLKR